MKVYNFEIIKSTQTIIFLISYILLGFTFITAIAYYTQNTNLTLAFFFLFAFSFIFYKKVLPFECLNIKMNDQGIIISNKGIEIDWNSIVWYYYLCQSSSMVEVIELKLKSGNKIRFSFFKRSSKANNWNEFKTDFFQIVESKNIDLLNYYKYKKWSFILWFIIASWLFIPLLFAYLPGDKLKKALMFVTYLISTMPLVIAIIDNRSRLKSK